MSTAFDPDAAAAPGSGLFGLTSLASEALVHVIPVPFEATTSYRRGTAQGPQAVLEASKQVELFDLELGKPYEAGIHMLAAHADLARLNAEGCALAARISAAEEADEAQHVAERERVNEIGGAVNRIVHAAVQEVLAADRLPAVLGGDHSVSFGAIEACAERFGGMGILHFDAHADLREAYQGYTWSHASIFWNVIQRISGLGKIVQVGLRDLGEREYECIQASEGRLHPVFDSDWAHARNAGEDLRDIVRRNLALLPETVYITFDVDGLDPTLCPNTGTPVPGGLLWSEATLWLKELAASGRRVVGLDLTEVSPGSEDRELDTWDAIVGARLLYRLIAVAVATRA